MKVKIIKASQPNWWYANHIGEIFTVESSYFNDKNVFKVTDSESIVVKECFFGFSESESLNLYIDPKDVLIKSPFSKFYHKDIWNKPYPCLPFEYPKHYWELKENKSLKKLQKKIINWAKEKDLIFPDNSKNQLLKTVSELGELSDALLKSDSEKIKDGIGDVLVTLIILAGTKGLTLKECLNQAWNEIKTEKVKL